MENWPAIFICENDSHEEVRGVSKLAEDAIGWFGIRALKIQPSRCNKNSMDQIDMPMPLHELIRIVMGMAAVRLRKFA